MFICGVNHLLVTNRAAWLNNTGYSNLMRCVNSIPEWEKRIRHHHRSMCSLTRPPGCYPYRLDAAGLAGTDADGGETGRSWLYEYDAVALHLSANGDAETSEISHAFIGGGCCDALHLVPVNLRRAFGLR